MRTRQLAFGNKTTKWTSCTGSCSSVLMDHDGWQHGVTAAVDVALLGRFYERFADHAVEIGRRVVFQGTGTLPPEQEVGTY